MRRVQTADIREIMDLEALGRHLSSFLQISSLPLVLLDAQSQPVAVPGLEMPPCLYCQLMQSCPQGETRCRRFRQQAGLQAARALAQAGETSVKRLRDAVLLRWAEKLPLGRLDYLTIVHPESMTPLVQVDGPALMACAVRMGKARLIDNIVLKD